MAESRELNLIECPRFSAVEPRPPRRHLRQVAPRSYALVVRNQVPHRATLLVHQQLYDLQNRRLQDDRHLQDQQHLQDHRLQNPRRPQIRRRLPQTQEHPQDVFAHAPHVIRDDAFCVGCRTSQMIQIILAILAIQMTAKPLLARDCRRGIVTRSWEVSSLKRTRRCALRVTGTELCSVSRSIRW